MSRSRNPRVSLAGLVLMLATPLAAQTASYSYIDQKAPYANPAFGPLLTAVNLPKVGTTFKVQVPHPYTIGFIGPFLPYLSVDFYLALGVSNPNLPIPGMSGYLFTSAEIVLTAFPNTSGPVVTMSFPIPNSPQLVGVSFYQQVLSVLSSYPGGIWNFPTTSCFALSRGGHGVIGR